MTKKVSDLTKEELGYCELIAAINHAMLYDRETGEFIWINPSSNNCKPGRIAGNVDSQGYVTIALHGKRYKAHRLAWLLENGVFPDGQIDNINHNRSDNRIENLRVVTNRQNCMNRSMTKKNSSGAVGVWFSSEVGKWRAGIVAEGKNIHLGYFSEFDGAVNARKSAESKYGFHENHGEVIASRYGEEVPGDE